MKRPEVQFTVNGLADSPVFKTHDIINGDALFTPHQETNMDDISISFVGTLDSAWNLFQNTLLGY